MPTWQQRQRRGVRHLVESVVVLNCHRRRDWGGTGRSSVESVRGSVRTAALLTVRFELGVELERAALSRAELAVGRAHLEGFLVVEHTVRDQRAGNGAVVAHG